MLQVDNLKMTIFTLALNKNIYIKYITVPTTLRH